MKWSTEYVPEDTSSARLRASTKGLEAFVRAGYGLSVHWGLYALIGRYEWVYNAERIPLGAYRQLMSRFNATRFNAEEWADLMLESGQKFMIITSKHHDGFCMYDTALTDFKVTNTAFKRDPLAELSTALRERGLGLHFYYSLLDWTHPAYRDDWPAYVAYYQGQLRELLTDYGPIGGVIFDGYWPRAVWQPGEEHFPPRGSLDLAGTFDLIHALQPDAVVTCNQGVPAFTGEDFQVSELDFPGEDTTGQNTTVVADVPQAVWWTVNSGWSYAPGRHACKTADSLWATLRRCRDLGAVLLLNVGPRPFGDIHPDEQRVLREVGQLLRAG